MKKIEVKSRLVAIAVLLMSSSIVSDSALAQGGATGGNGGFAFRKSNALLTEATGLTVDLLVNTNNICFNKLLNKDQLKPIELKRMAEIIKKVRSSPSIDRSRLNPLGMLEPLAFDYGTDATGEYIEVLKPFFVGFMSYNDQLTTGWMVYATMRNLIHEAAHHFNFNESEASVLADSMINPQNDHTPPSWRQYVDRSHYSAAYTQSTQKKRRDSPCDSI